VVNDAVCESIAKARCGLVEAPAGCGKTEAIVRTVGAFCREPQLVLTHTHAGVDALRRRFREHGVPANKYHVDTIAGWCWGWVRKYPISGRYPGSTDIAVWNDVYAAMTVLLGRDFVRQGILNSYAGVIVDEYQDCTVSMHRLVVALKQVLPCRVLGDELQGIFGFGRDSSVPWVDVRDEFANDLGSLATPHRWIKAGNESLGTWLLGARTELLKEQEPVYEGAPIDRQFVPYSRVGIELIRLTHKKQGRICVIGPKARPLPSGLETTLVKQGYRVLEANELSALRDLIIGLSDEVPYRRGDAIVKFISRVHGGLPSDEQKFIAKLAAGQPQCPRRSDRQLLCARHASGPTLQMISDLLHYVSEIEGVSCKLRESISAMKCIFERHLQSGVDIKTLYAQEIARRKHQSRGNVYRSIGTTLLVKGLEFEHVVILRDPKWQKNWGSHKDLYVALTRGAKSTTLMELS
jgi:hypothetical protein